GRAVQLHQHGVVNVRAERAFNGFEVSTVAVAGELLSASPAGRRGRIFLDYLRNGRGNTAVGAYSPRARPKFPIASPVTWSQVEKGIPADAFTIRDAS